MTSRKYIDDNLHELELRPAPNKVLVRICLRNDSDFLIGEASEKLDYKTKLLIEDSITGLGLETETVNFCEVLAVGDSRPWTKHECKVYGVAKYFSPDIRVGDIVLLPKASRNGRLWNRIFCDYDVMVDNHECVMIIREN